MNTRHPATRTRPRGSSGLLPPKHRLRPLFPRNLRFAAHPALARSFPVARAPLAGLALVLTACVGQTTPPAAGADPAADSARAILERVSPALASEAFARLDSTEYTADIRMEDNGEPETLRRVQHFPTADDNEALRVTNPVAQMLPDDPPHLAVRTRDRYRFRLLPEVRRAGRRFAGAEAVLRDPDAPESVRRVRSWIDADTGAPHSVEVWRRSSSAIFDEEGRAGVAFRRGQSGMIPAATSSTTYVDVPFGEPRRVSVDVTIRGAGE